MSYISKLNRPYSSRDSSRFSRWPAEMRAPMPQEGVVLDGFLTYMDQTRKDYKLREPQFSLKQIEDDEIDSLNEIQGSVIKRNGSRIFSSRHPLLSGLKPDVYGEKIDSDTNPRWRIRPDSVGLVLWKVIERALQTIVQLGDKVPPRIHLEVD